MRTIYFCYPGGKHKALTMSYDDGRSEDRRLVSIFNANGIKGTFNLNSGLSGDGAKIPQAEWAELYRGHEIACHTLTHPTLERCPTEHVALQVLEDRKALERVTGYPVRGLAYPNGSHSPAIKALLPALGIAYARVVANGESFAQVTDPFEWKPTCHHDHRLSELGDEFLALRKTQYLYLMSVWGHSYEFAQKGNWDAIESFCGKMAFKDDVWYATNIEVIDNADACRRMRVAADGSFAHNPSAASVWLSVDGSIVEVPGGAKVDLR
jgi:peptidoglycan/xylan/chitin deacetylase (PgdA/CDA1 family)